jgi:hypothetical protein
MPKEMHMSTIIATLLPWAVSFVIAATIFSFVFLLSRIPDHDDDQQSALLAGCIVFGVALGVAAPLYIGMPESWAFPFVFWACNLVIVGVLLRQDARSVITAFALWTLGLGVLANYVLFRDAPSAGAELALKTSALLLFSVSVLLFLMASFQRPHLTWFERYILRKTDKPRMTASSVASTAGGVVSGAVGFITQAKDMPQVLFILSHLHLAMK